MGNIGYGTFLWEAAGEFWGYAFDWEALDCLLIKV